MNIFKNYILYKIFNRLAFEFKPNLNSTKQRNISPHLLFANKFEIESEYINKYKSKNSDHELTFLDIGGRKGEFKYLAANFDYHILELEKKEKTSGITYIQGDICDCPNIKDASYDIIFSNNVFEHLEQPWDAAKECVRLTKKNGLIIHNAPFAWRYHPCPVDYFRFSSQGLASLFTRTREVDILFSGYDISDRRNDHRGSMKMNLDVPPIDEYGGFRENWMSIFIGIKR